MVKNRKLRFEQCEARRLLVAGGLVDDAYEIQEDSSLVAWGDENVLANDTGVSRVGVVDQPANGLLIFGKNGNFGYKPNANFSGSDTFTYRDLNGDDTKATVTITVVADNSGVDAVNDTYEVVHDSLLRVRDDEVVIANDTNVTRVSLSEGPSHGSVTLSPNGSFNYIPDDNFVGEDSFTYVGLGDEGGADAATVTINVTNEAPKAVDDAYTVAEDNVLDANVSILANDSDADGDSFTFDIEAQPQHGHLDINMETGTFKYNPDPNFYGEDTFKYALWDGLDVSNIATVTITVTPVNDAPIANDDEYETFITEDLVVGAPGVLANDTDVDNETIVAALVTGPDKGELILQEDGSFAYKPDKSQTADYTTTFVYSASDGSAFMHATVTIDVMAKPQANDDRYEILENTVYTGSVLDNDLNTDGAAVTLVDDPDHGNFIFDKGTFIYQPNEDYFGMDSFIYVVSRGDYDSLAEVQLNVHDDVVTDAIANDTGFKTSDDLAEGDLDKAAAAAKEMNVAIYEAVTANDAFIDQTISVEEMFAINQYIIANYMTTNEAGKPIWINTNGEEIDRVLNTGNNTYYDGAYANWHGDDANGRRQYGKTGENIEHGYHLIQNDGGTSTLDTTTQGYTINKDGGDGDNLWTTVLDGLFHAGFDIVKGDANDLTFADGYEAGVDFYFLNEDGNRNQSLADVASWLTWFMRH